MPDPFLTLGVLEDADDSEIRAAYLKLVRRFPPDRFPSEFQIISEAYQAIGDEVSRARRRVFGVLKEGASLVDLAPDLPRERRRIGVDTWLEPFGGGRGSE